MYIGFCKHAAARRDGIELLAAERERIKLGGRNVEQRGHLVDERARPAGARTVHALLKPAGKKDDLRVLAAKLDDAVGVGRIRLDDFAGRKNLLDKRQARRFGDAKPRRTGKRHAHRLAADNVARHADQLQRLWPHLRHMTLILLIDDFAVFYDNNLNRRRTDVDADSQRANTVRPVHDRAPLFENPYRANTVYSISREIG